MSDQTVRYIYSLSVLLTELLCLSRTNPWTDDCKVPCISSYVLEKKTPTLPEHANNISPVIFKRFSELITRCWNEDPSQRPNIKEVINELKSLKGLLQPESKEDSGKDRDQLTTDNLLHSDDRNSKQDSTEINILNLSMHQGYAFENFGDITVGFEEAGTSISGDLHADMEEQTLQNSGSNACTFFAMALAHSLETHVEK